MENFLNIYLDYLLLLCGVNLKILNLEMHVHTRTVMDVLEENTQKRRMPTIGRQGFTLLEMLVVLVIIGMLAGLIGPRMFGRVDDSKVKTAKIQIKMLKGCLETMRLDINNFPTTEQGLALLFHRPNTEPLKSQWQGPYIDEEIPLDPWGNPYQYSVPGRDNYPYALYSFGADGKPGGDGKNAEIGYPGP